MTIMKNLMALASLSLMMVLLFSACDKNEGREDKPLSSFSIAMNDIDRSIEVGVTPSDTTAMYIMGLISESELQEIGGEEGLSDYAAEILASGEGIVSQGVSSRIYEDLFYLTTYYAYVVEIRLQDDVYSLVGTPVVQSKLLKKSYISFEPAELTIAPFAISDNGYYVVGNFQDGSYLYDLRRDSLLVVPSVAFNDVTDDGVVFGQDLVSMEGLIYRNGEVEYVKGPDNAAEVCFFAANNDGSQAVGYYMNTSFQFMPFVYTNGVFETLEMPVTADGKPAAMGVAKGIGANGVIAGYGLIDMDYAETSLAWNLPGGTNLAIGNDLMSIEGDFWNYIYGDMFTYISHGGKYIASNYSDFTAGIWEEVINSYVYDVDSGELNSITDPQIENYRLGGVMDNGEITLSNTPYGLSEIPFIYSPDEAVLYNLNDYLQTRFNYVHESQIEGSLIAVSADCRIFVVASYGEGSGSGYVTNIFVM